MPQDVEAFRSTKQESPLLRARSSIRRGTKTGERIAQHITSEIALNGLEPGDPLPSELELIERYQVGRASVREALRILEVQGLIIIRTGLGGGPRVAAPSAEDFARIATLHLRVARATFRELLDTRAVLESFLARQAAVRHDRPALDVMQATIDRCDRATKTSEVLQWTFAFHQAVSDAAGNRVLQLFSDGVAHIWGERSVVAGHFNPDNLGCWVEDHKLIAASIIAGDGDTAERLMRDHLNRAAEEADQTRPGELDDIVNWA